MTATEPASPSNQHSFSQLLARYERIIEISQQLNSTLDHATLLRRIIAASMELTTAEAASILLIDPATGELRFEQTSNMDDSEMNSIVVPLEGSIAGWVAVHGEARVIEDVSQEPRFFSSVDDAIDFQTRNILAVPMRTRNKVVGTLEAVNKADGQPFDDEDVKILTTLASQAASAIENARLFQQSDFMAEMVHELRTPLAAIKTSLALLQRDLPEEYRDEIMTTMQQETNRLIRMTSDFLDLARLESGRTRLERGWFDLGELVSECAGIIRPQAHEQNIKVTAAKDSLSVFGDSSKLKQVLLNLLTNAIKYNRDGGSITITTTTIERQGQSFVQISVRDTGYGISAENQKQLFQRFYRVSDTAGFTQGTGLGLAIARRIVEAHGGEIWVESRERVGSTFSFSIPLV
jgi:signal transduction histidine kinase